MTGIDKKQALEEMREEYRRKTGEELPDHVLENYDEFFSLGPGFDDIDEMMTHAELASRKRHGIAEVGIVSAIVVVATAIISFGVGFAVSTSFGTGIAALVAAGIGFIVGSLIT